MSPYQQVDRLYRENPQAQSFGWYISFHMQHGFVFATPDYFIMGRHVRKDAPEEHITEPTMLFKKAESDCWYVHAMAGDISKVWDIMPWPLGYIAFERLRAGKRELQIQATERLRRFAPVITSIHSA